MLSSVASVALFAAAALAATDVPAIPLVYNYGTDIIYPRIQANLKWGTKPQQQIPTIFDTGSVGFWVYGPNSTINDGTTAHFSEGPCNKSVTTFFNYPASSSEKDLTNLTRAVSYAYGGNGKIVTAYKQLNDTFSFPSSAWPAIANNRVSIANFTVVAQGDDGCRIPVSSFDQSILGLAPYGKSASGISNVGPSFRYDLYDQGRTASHSFSMWFDKAPTSAKGQFKGRAIFGAVPSKSNYKGDLVRVALDPPSGSYIGYYVKLPTLTVTNITKAGAKTTVGSVDSSVKQCLLDSGTGTDNVPFNQSELVKATGLLHYNKHNYDFIAYNGSCDQIPESAALNYTFAGSTSGKSVTISVPIRSYARGQYDALPGVSKDVCGLSISASEYGYCTFGAPFFTAAFAVFNDDAKQVALAQGGVSTNAAAGLSGVGTLTPIPKGKNVPGSV